MRFIGNELARLRRDGKSGRLGGGVGTGTMTKNSDRFGREVFGRSAKQSGGVGAGDWRRLWSGRGGGGRPDGDGIGLSFRAGGGGVGSMIRRTMSATGVVLVGLMMGLVGCSSVSRNEPEKQATPLFFQLERDLWSAAITTYKGVIPVEQLKRHALILNKFLKGEPRPGIKVSVDIPPEPEILPGEAKDVRLKKGTEVVVFWDNGHTGGGLLFSFSNSGRLQSVSVVHGF